MATLHLVRHGETTANVMHRLDTALPGDSLTDFGVRQGVRFGLDNRPAGEPVLVSSLARRARETAEAIASVWDVDPVALEGIHEVQVGDLESRHDEEAHGVFTDIVNRWYAGEVDARIPGGESLTMVHGRFLPVIDHLVATHLTGPDRRDVYVVSHGAAIRLIASHLTGIDAKFAAATRLPNTGSVEIEYTDAGVWVCKRWGAAPAPFGRDDEPLVVEPMG